MSDISDVGSCGDPVGSFELSSPETMSSPRIAFFLEKTSSNEAKITRVTKHNMWTKLNNLNVRKCNVDSFYLKNWRRKKNNSRNYDISKFVC